ncbi:MAG: PKD domain-containing protein, partial [Bacteroidales bacterium]|nr:PKD domain-containing protein [Bacteroidales bacterium]
SDCILDSNRANVTLCGGLSISGSDGNLLNTLIINNYWSGAYSSGGLNVDDSELDLVNVTFANNLQYGIVIGSNAVVNLTNNILWGNLAEQILNYGTVNIKHSIIQDSINGILNSGTVNWLTGNRFSDPYFKDPSSNNYQLTDSSICVNAGTPDTTGMNLPFFDLAGYPRIVFDTIDMGAYEFQGTVIPPLITQNPLNKTVCELDSTGFSVQASGFPKYYQWQKDNQDIPLATDSIYTLNPALLTDDGNYRCIVWNPVGRDTSNVASLTVNSLPQFSLGVDTNICIGDTLILDPGSGYISYLWHDASTSQTFEDFQTGLYWVEVTNVEGCIKRDSIYVTVNPNPLADFTYSQGCEDNFTQFFDQSIPNSPSIIDWYWDFGDPAITTDTATMNDTVSYMYNSTGTYQVYLSVTNTFGCSDTITKYVDVYNSPVVDLGSDSYICSGDLVNLVPIITGGVTPYTYLWSTGHTEPFIGINPISDTTITIIVTDYNGCAGYDTINLFMRQVFQGEEICIVTVDTASQKNLIVWEKTHGVGTAYYNIYRYDNDYQVIGSVPFDSLSVFIDENSFPDQYNYLYKISSVDSCGIESMLSDYHQTIKLTTSVGFPSGVALTWNSYYGFEYFKFYIYRGSSYDNLYLIDSVNKFTFTHNDLNPPPLEYYYRIVVNKHPDSICNPSTGKAASGPFKQSLSNIGDGGEVYEFQIKVFLEGPYSNYQMSTYLYQDNLIPRFQPFNIAPWYYFGEEYVPDIPNPQIIDWILFELRETSGGIWTATSDSIIYRQAAFLRNNGYVVDLDGGSNLHLNAILTEDLYLIIWHRNHICIMSGFPLQLFGNLFIHDFTTGLDKVYGGINGYKQLDPGVWGMAGGDGNGDGLINLFDKDSAWIQFAGKKGYFNGDYNIDGQINNLDKNDYWLPNDGKGTQVPE